MPENLNFQALDIFEETAIFYVHDAISHVKDAVIVGDHHNRDTFCLGKVLENIGNGATSSTIKSGGWFVGKHEAGTRH